LLSSSLSSSRLYLQEYSHQLAITTSRLREIAASCLCQLNVSATSFKDNVSAIFNRSWDSAAPFVTDFQERLWLIIQWLKELVAQLWEIISSQRSLPRPQGARDFLSFLTRVKLSLTQNCIKKILHTLRNHNKNSFFHHIKYNQIKTSWSQISEFS
jgi:hypothetical protein